MNHWLANSIKNLVPLSKATEFEVALAEWFFTGEVDDYEDKDEDLLCELCNHADLLHHFQIKNSYTESTLLVGSSCILKFQQIVVRDRFGKPITDPSMRKKALDATLREKIVETSLVPLRKLWTKNMSRRNEIEFLAREIRIDQGLLPKQLSDLLTYLEQYGIESSAKLYKVNLRGHVAVQQVAVMSQHEFQRVLPALSSAQVAKARKVRREG
jgi:hypothetical protein